VLGSITLLSGIAGCGTNWEQLLVQTGSAVGRTYIDLFLTDVANGIADRLDEQPADDDDGDADDGNGDDTNGDGDGDDTGGDLSDLTGDPAAGEALYASCAGCHCADASGGCLPNAPSLIGVSAETNDEYLRGDASHPTKPALTDQDIVDLAAYLGSL
jgi:mono/diheme cytochrome c family protein